MPSQYLSVGELVRFSKYPLIFSRRISGDISLNNPAAVAGRTVYFLSSVLFLLLCKLRFIKFLDCECEKVLFLFCFQACAAIRLQCCLLKKLYVIPMYSVATWAGAIRGGILHRSQAMVADFNISNIQQIRKRERTEYLNYNLLQFRGCNRMNRGSSIAAFTASFLRLHEQEE